jgi:hypothetical protein
MDRRLGAKVARRFPVVPLDSVIFEPALTVI